jgi:hypothetical protein
LTMISLLTPSTPPEVKTESDAFFHLLAICSSPDETKKRVAALYEAALKATEAKAEAEDVLKRLSTEKASHDALIAKERQEHDAALKAERVACNTQCDRAMEEVRKAKAEADRLLKKAKIDSEAAATLRADLEARLAKIREAAA